MNEEEKKAKLEAIRQHIQKNDEAWLAWSVKAAESAVQGLLTGNLLQPEHSDLARKLMAEDLLDAGKSSYRHVLAELQRLHRESQGP